jgi:hypothetical protein
METEAELGQVHLHRRHQALPFLLTNRNLPVQAFDRSPKHRCLCLEEFELGPRHHLLHLGSRLPPAVLHIINLPLKADAGSL